MPKIKLFWEKKNRPSNSDTILINGKTVVFIMCSVISAFINLVFITNLTKSAYSIGTLLPVPAAILLGLMSIGLDFSKCLHAIQVNTLNELYRKLSKYPWAKKIKNVSRKWFTVYILYVILSIITSVSLSSISIGAGITRNANTLKQIDEFIIQGETYIGVDSTAKNVTMKNLIDKATDTSEQDAKDWVIKQTEEVWPIIEAYQFERSEFEKEFTVSSEQEIEWSGNKIIPSNYWDIRNNEVNVALQKSKYSVSKLSGQQIKTLTLALFEKNIKKNYLNTYATTNSDEALKKMNALTDTTMDEAYGWVVTLNNVGLVNPKTGEFVTFDTDINKPTKVLVSSALTILKSLRVDIENDSGDIGSSSKIFMQLGSTIDNKKNNNSTDLNDVLNIKSEGSFGSTEVMMMLMLLFLSLLCELAINQFSPKTTISRKMLSQFSQYFPADYDINDLMLDIAIEQYNFGFITKEEFEKQAKNIVSMKEMTKKNIEEKYKAVGVKKPKKKKPSKPKKTEEAIVEQSKAEEVIVEQPILEASKTKEAVKEPSKPKRKRVERHKAEEVIAEQPSQEVQQEIKIAKPRAYAVRAAKKKIIIKSAETELEEMLNENKSKKIDKK